MMRNLSVIACNEIDGFYYPGFVSSSQEDDTIWVRFYAIKPGWVPRDEVIFIGGAVPWPELQVSDYALVRVMCRTTRAEYYVPGIVRVLPRGQGYATKFYTLQLYNGRFVEKLRRNIVKIGPHKFKAVFDYIAKLRYGGLSRSVTVENLFSNREPLPKMRKRWSSCSMLRLYHDKKEKRTVFRLHDNSWEKKIRPEPPKKQHRFFREPQRDEISNGEYHKNPKTAHQSYPRPWQSDTEDVTVRSDTTSYSDDTVSKSEVAKREKKEQHHSSCDTLNSVEPRDTKSAQSRRNQKKPQVLPRKKERKSSQPVVVRSATSSPTSSITSVVEPKRTLHPGQEVLARWSDDGWYYCGVVVKADGTDRYIIMDSTGYTESILLDDVVLDSDNEFCVLQPFDHVIALHRKYLFSYAPAVVRDVYRNGLTVIFYDKTQQKLPNSEVYKIKHSQYKRCVEYIRDCESRLAKSAVIARDDKTGLYQKCEIVCPEGVGQNFIVKWPNGELCRQTGKHIFEIDPGSHSQQKIKWKYALAPMVDNLSFYLPAEVIQTNPFRVKIFNQSRVTECCNHLCFWLNEAYYTNAVNFYNNIAFNREK